MFNKFKIATLILFFIVALSLSVFVILGSTFPENRKMESASINNLVTVNGSKIAFNYKDGEKPILIFLHGFGGNYDGWENVQILLPYKSYALDQIGFGRSDKPNEEYDLETHRRYIIGFMDKMGIESVILVGQSMGASVAAWTAAKTPDRISGVVMIAPSAYPGSLSYKWPLAWFYRPGPMNFLTRRIVSTNLFRWMYPNSLAQQALGVTSSYNTAFSDALSDINQPALLAWSKSDKTALYKYHNEYLKRIENLEFMELPGKYGHGKYWEYPKDFAKYILTFVERNY